MHLISSSSLAASRHRVLFLMVEAQLTVVCGCLQLAGKETEKFSAFFNTYRDADSDCIGPEGTSKLCLG